MEDDKIFIPSFKVEEKTHSFNKYIWSFVTLISIFTLLLGTLMFTLCAEYVFGIISTFTSEHMIIIMLIPVAIFIVLSYQLVLFINDLSTSYKFENDKIIKGRIQNKGAARSNNIWLETVVTIDKATNLLNSNRVNADKVILRLNSIFAMIENNMNMLFVKNYFETDIYKKKVYSNPKLIKETKYSLIYLCENNKKLVIPKIYDKLCEEGRNKKSSFISRIIKRAIVVFLISMCFSIMDLSISYSQNNKYISSIENTYSMIEEKIKKYGYELENQSEKLCRFEKVVGNNKKSQIKYIFDKNGNITDIEIQLYYEINDENARDELEYIITTMNDSFDKNQKDTFMKAFEESIEGNYKYAKLVSKNNKYDLVISKSEGYIDIH